MTHLTVREWGRVAIGTGADCFSDAQARALLAAARDHPVANDEATNILIDRRDHLKARQVVGIIAAEDCSLEILPKVDPDASAAALESELDVRSRLVAMLDVALGLDLSVGGAASIARQEDTLLEVFIRAFADELLMQVRRGLPRLYRERHEDLPALRGRLDVARQFTVNAVRPDRLACRFDQLEADGPLLRIMAAAVEFLLPHARREDTRRTLFELRHAFVDVPKVSVRRLPWNQVRIDRTNRRWSKLFTLAELLLKREWEATHHEGDVAGISLLFAMNDLFEAYIGALLRTALADTDYEVVEQGGRRHCLGQYTGEALARGTIFQTKPDIILRRGGRTSVIVDTKWKKLATDPLDAKHGVGQGDVYQLITYARVYGCEDLMLLYPAIPGKPDGLRTSFGIVNSSDRLRIATIDIAQPRAHIEARLRALLMAGNLEAKREATSRAAFLVMA